MTIIDIACGILCALSTWTTLVVLSASLRWGTGVDYYRWGWRSWRARCPRGLDTTTPSCYIQFGWAPLPLLPVYAGQSVNPTARFRSEGKEIMALAFAFGMATDPAGTLVITEDPSAGARSGRGSLWTVPFIP